MAGDVMSEGGHVKCVRKNEGKEMLCSLFRGLAYLRGWVMNMGNE